MATSGLTLRDFKGLSNQDGLAVADDAHLVQSIRDLLTTPIGSRVMRRSYGSRLPTMVDAPMNRGLLADATAAIAEALQAFEPRVRLESVSAREVAAGKLTVDLVVIAQGRPLKLEGVI
jgi:phage baseplate assembly protein W